MTTLDNFFTIDVSPLPKWRWSEFSKRTNALGKDAARRIADETRLPDVNGGAIHANQSIPFKLQRRGARSDVLGTDSGVAVYSSRLIEILDKAKCTGLRHHPAVLYDLQDDDIIDDNLHWIRTLIGAELPDEHRGFPLYFTDHWRRDMYMTDVIGLYFDPASWTGLDIFRFPRSHTVIITKRIANIISAADLDGIVLESVPEYGKALRDDKVRWLKQKYPSGLPPDVAL